MRLANRRTQIAYRHCQRHLAVLAKDLKVGMQRTIGNRMERDVLHNTLPLVVFNLDLDQVCFGGVNERAQALFRDLEGDRF